VELVVMVFARLTKTSRIVASIVEGAVTHSVTPIWVKRIRVAPWIAFVAMAFAKLLPEKRM